METLNLTYNEESSEDAENFFQSEVTNINLGDSQGKLTAKRNIKKNIPMTPSMFDLNESQTELLDASNSEQDATLESSCSIESHMTEETACSLDTQGEAETDEENEFNGLTESSDDKNPSNLIHDETTQVSEEHLTGEVLEREQKPVEAQINKKRNEKSENEVKRVRGGNKNFPKSAQVNNLNNVAEENHAQFYVYSVNEKSEEEQENKQNVKVENTDSESKDKEETQQVQPQNDKKKAKEQKEPTAGAKRKPRKRFTRGTQVQSPNFKPAPKGEKRKTKVQAQQIEKTEVVEEKDIVEVSNAVDNVSLNDTLTEQNIEELDKDPEPIAGPSSTNTSIDIKSENSNNSSFSSEGSPPTYLINIERDIESPNERNIYIALPPTINSKVTNINVRMTKKTIPKEKKVTFLQEASVIDLTADEPIIKKEKYVEQDEVKRSIKPRKEKVIKKAHSHGRKHLVEEKRRKPVYRKRERHYRSPSDSESDFSGHCSCSDCNEDYGGCSHSCSCSSGRSSSEELSEIDYYTKTRHKRSTRVRY